jgi:hypothetical protein
MATVCTTCMNITKFLTLHTTFLCFLSRQAIITLHSNNRLVFVMETKCFCDEGNDFLYITHFNAKQKPIDVTGYCYANVQSVKI